VSEKPDFSSLVTSLNQSNLQKTNYAAYQTILFLIKNVLRFANLTQADIDQINEDLSTIFAATFLTVNDETDDFVNSRQLLAGTGITFDDTIAGERTINSSGGTGNYYDSPLSDGDLIQAELIFGNGDPIICQVPNVP
jgi:hypothetical protein